MCSVFFVGDLRVLQRARLPMLPCEHQSFAEKSDPLQSMSWQESDSGAEAWSSSDQRRCEWHGRTAATETQSALDDRATTAWYAVQIQRLAVFAQRRARGSGHGTFADEEEDGLAHEAQEELQCSPIRC